jgi:transposase
VKDQGRWAGHDGAADKLSEAAVLPFQPRRAIPARHLLRRINPTVTRVLAGVREKLQPFYSDIGRPSIDPELMIRMLVVATAMASAPNASYARRSNCTWPFAGFADSLSTTRFRIIRRSQSNRHGRFRESDLFRQAFEAVVRACMNAGLVKGEGFAVDATTDPCSAWTTKAKARAVRCRPCPGTAAGLTFAHSARP